MGLGFHRDLAELQESRQLAVQVLTIPHIVCLIGRLNNFPDCHKGDVENIGGSCQDDSREVQKGKEGLSPTAEIVSNCSVTPCKPRKQDSHGGKSEADGDRSKYWVAVFDQPCPVQDIADEVKEGQEQLCIENIL